MKSAGLVAIGNACLENREDIPGAPLWHMGKVAVFESKENLEFLQNTIDYLACKGKLNKKFTDDEKEFMKELFEALWWGGRYHGYKEAAKLADHYVNGEGKKFVINPEIYKNSIIVSDAMIALKDYIRDATLNKKTTVITKSSDPGFLRSKHVISLKQGKRSSVRKGYILKDGALLVEQSNHRLKNADHRFHLQNSTKKANNVYISRWMVESKYDFEPFSKGYVTEIPLAKDLILKLPDGLSHHLTNIGVAKDFIYTSTWYETWQ